jgi:hypothetical protein
MTDSHSHFIQLVLMFQMNAMQAMGKLKNPLTDRIERNLEAAQISIDLLDMLHEKTRGNLSPEEDRLLVQVLQDLRLNFVHEASKKEEPGPETASGQTGQAGAAGTGEGQGATKEDPLK